jgi:hypothetical protein
MGVSISEFRKRYDVQHILLEVMQSLTEDTLYEKSDVIKMSGLRPGYPGMSTVLESEEFKKYHGRADSKDWYAQPELIAQLKDEGMLR